MLPYVQLPMLNLTRMRPSLTSLSSFSARTDVCRCLYPEFHAHAHSSHLFQFILGTQLRPASLLAAPARRQVVEVALALPAPRLQHGGGVQVSASKLRRLLRMLVVLTSTTDCRRFVRMWLLRPLQPPLFRYHQARRRRHRFVRAAGQRQRRSAPLSPYTGQGIVAAAAGPLSRERKKRSIKYCAKKLMMPCWCTVIHAFATITMTSELKFRSKTLHLRHWKLEILKNKNVLRQRFNSGL